MSYILRFPLIQTPSKTTNLCSSSFHSKFYKHFKNSNFKVYNTPENSESTNHDYTGIYLHTPAGCRIGFSFRGVYYMNVRILFPLLFKKNHGVVVFTVGIPDVLPSISRLCKLFFFLLPFICKNKILKSLYF